MILASLSSVSSLWMLAIAVLSFTQVLRVSLLYETSPMYVLEQAPFLNAAVLGRTDLSPLQLLYHLKQIEKAAGRYSVVNSSHHHQQHAAYCH